MGRYIFVFHSCFHDGIINPFDDCVSHRMIYYPAFYEADQR